MTKVDFYILQASGEDARRHFCCRLVDKALRAGHRILVTTDTQAEAEHLDDLLWTFKPESFIPHQLLDASRTATAPVLICGDLPAQYQPAPDSLLINLRQDIPAWFSAFARVSEVVIQSPDVLKNTRQHYSFYRQGGYAIEHRKV